MVEDLAAGRLLEPAEPDAHAAERLVQQRQPKRISCPTGS